MNGVQGIVRREFSSSITSFILRTDSRQVRRERLDLKVGQVECGEPDKASNPFESG